MPATGTPGNQTLDAGLGAVRAGWDRTARGLIGVQTEVDNASTSRAAAVNDLVAAPPRYYR